MLQTELKLRQPATNTKVIINNPKASYRCKHNNLNRINIFFPLCPAIFLGNKQRQNFFNSYQHVSKHN